MLLPPAPYHSAERFSAPVSGLRSLLVAPDAGRGAVVTRAAAVASRGGEDDVKANVGRREVTKKTVDEGPEDMEAAAKEKDAGITEDEEEELDGFWVSYGRRYPRRRLPPPIPSLVARGALRRTRTGDGRLVIRIVPVVRPECIRPRRRRRDRDRLTMQLVEHEDDSQTMAPPVWELLSSARQDDIGIAQASDGTATTPAVGVVGVDDVEEAAAAPEPETMALAVPPPRASSAGCFEDVFKFDPIGSSSLRPMPSLRMVH